MDKKSMIKRRGLWRLLWFIAPPLIFLSLLIQTSPKVPAAPALSAQEAKQAKTVVKQIMRSFASERRLVEVSLKQSDLNAISAVAAHTLPNTAFDVRLSPFGLLGLASLQLNFFPTNPYLNVECLAAPGLDRFEIDYCELGHLPIPGAVVKWVAKTMAFMLFGRDVEQTLIAFLEDARIRDDRILFSAMRSDSFNQDIKDSLGEMVRLASVFNRVDLVQPALVEQNLTYLKRLDARRNGREASLAGVLAQVMDFAAQTEATAVEQNAAALWAMVIRYGNPAFARAIGLEPEYGQEEKIKLTLQGRRDLALHFLYSIALDQISESDIGLNVGEFKEVLDSAKGGSGFSFADLAADKAGLAFSSYAMSGEDAARATQLMVNGNANENVFFPDVSDLPEGLDEQRFKRRYGSVQSEAYLRQEAKIDARIENLPLYRFSGM